MKNIIKAFAYFFLLLMIFLLSSIFLLSCSSRKSAVAISDTKTETKTETRTDVLQNVSTITNIDTTKIETTNSFEIEPINPIEPIEITDGAGKKTYYRNAKIKNTQTKKEQKGKIDVEKTENKETRIKKQVVANLSVRTKNKTTERTGFNWLNLLWLLLLAIPFIAKKIKDKYNL